MEQIASHSSSADHPLPDSRLRLVEVAETNVTRLDDSPRTLHLQTLELYVGPFRSFRDIGRFREALAELPAVRVVRPRGLQRGTLQLRVQCIDARELLAQLQRAYYLPLQPVSQVAHQIELRIGESEEEEPCGEESLPA